MSWEEIAIDTKPCPCGKGNYTVIQQMDDWNRMEEKWQMECVHCANDYKLYTYHQIHKGMVETVSRQMI